MNNNMQNWDPRVDDFRDLNCSMVRGGPASNYTRNPYVQISQEAFALHVTQIPTTMTKSDLANFFGRCGRILDVNILRKKDGFDTNHAIVKVETVSQGLNIIGQFSRNQLGIVVRKARSAKSNPTDIDDKEGGFQPMKPTPMVKPDDNPPQNIKRENMVCTNKWTAGTSNSTTTEVTETINHISINSEPTPEATPLSPVKKATSSNVWPRNNSLSSTTTTNIGQNNQQNFRPPNKICMKKVTTGSNNNTRTKATESIKPTCSGIIVPTPQNEATPISPLHCNASSIQSDQTGPAETAINADINHINKKEIFTPDSSVEVKKKNSATSSVCSSITMKITNKRNMKCIFCKQEGVLRCSVCYAYYCSKQCQLDDWYSHQGRCKPPPALLDGSVEHVEELSFTVSPSTNGDSEVSNAATRDIDSATARYIDSVDDATTRDIASETSENNSSNSRQHITKHISSFDKLALVNGVMSGSKISLYETLDGRPEPTGTQYQHQKIHFKKLKKFPIEANKQYTVSPIYVNNFLFVRIHSPEVYRELDEFTAKLKSFFQRVSSESPSDLIPGELICVYDESDKNYYRAQILNLKDNIVLCYFVDYGIHEKVLCSNIRMFDSSFLDMPVTCFPLKNLRCCGAVKSIEEVYNNGYTLGMNVHNIDPLLVDLTDDTGSVVLTSKEIASKIEEELVSKTEDKPVQKLATNAIHNTDPKVAPEENGWSIYSKLFDDVEFVNLPIKSGVEVLITNKEMLPLINVIPLEEVEKMAQLEAISEEIQKYCESQNISSCEPKVNEVVLARYDSDEVWYRGVVMAVAEQSANIMFFDYGNLETVPLNMIYPMVQKFMELPIISSTCYVADLPDELSDDQRKTMLALIDSNEDPKIDVRKYSNGLYEISFPSLAQKFAEILATRH